MNLVISLHPNCIRVSSYCIRHRKQVKNAVRPILNADLPS